MIVWLVVGLLTCTAAKPTGQLTYESVNGPVQQDARIGLVAHEILPRTQDPTDSLICKYIQQARRTLYFIPIPQLHSFKNSVLGKYFVTSPVTSDSPASYFPAPPPSPPLFATLCVSPENPRPFPLLFSPPPPPAPAPVVAASPPSSSGSSISSTFVGPAPPAPIEAADPEPVSPASTGSPADVSKSPAPPASSSEGFGVPSSLSLIFGSPVGSIGIGGGSSPAVNIQLQQITDTQNPSLSVRREPVDLVSWRLNSDQVEDKVSFPKYVHAVWNPSVMPTSPVFLVPAGNGLIL